LWHSLFSRLTFSSFRLCPSSSSSFLLP
jgi:hypothetical protein